LIPGSEPREIAPRVWAVALPSLIPGPWDATTAFVVGDPDSAWLIDPGGTEPEGAELLAALLRAAGVRELKGVLLTHTHRDHVGALAAAVAHSHRPEAFVHPVAMSRLPGVAKRPLTPGRRLMAGSLTIRAIDTPGHASDHLAFHVPEHDLLLAGDLVSGRGAIWLGVPDGDVAQHLASLEVAAALAPRIVAPAHGAIRSDGGAVLSEARRHRLERERSVLQALTGPCNLTALRERLYPDVPAAGWEFAERSILAHLRKLMAEGRVMHAGSDAAGPYLPTPGRSG
jgi:glyoxylase-like metal-dependent hydrolase (beta-lactamase superfamily II)